MGWIDGTDSIVGLTPGGGEALKVSIEYRFVTATKHLNVNDSDFVRIISVFNATINEVIYILGSETFTGTTHNNELEWDTSLSSMTDSDELYIIYQANVINNVEKLLRKQIELSEINNKLLNKILD